MNKLTVTREQLIDKYKKEGCRKDDIKQLFPLMCYKTSLRPFINDVISKSRNICLSEAKFKKSLKGSEVAIIIEEWQ